MAKNVAPVINCFLNTILEAVSLGTVSNSCISLNYNLSAFGLKSSYKISIALKVLIVFPPAVLFGELNFICEENFLGKSNNAH